VSEIPIDKDDPFDGIDLNNLDGWIRYDSSRVRKTDHRSGMESDSGRGYSNSWVRLGDS